MREAYFRCMIAPGQFSDEFAVSGTQSNGQGFSLFAPRDLVTSRETPVRGQPVEGNLKVRIWQEEGSLAVIRLPGEPLETGPFVTVNVDQLTLPS
jgi:hypothetical protein